MGAPLVGYLGPEGTFTHQAAQGLCPDGELRPEDQIAAVIAAVAEGRYVHGIVPIENTVEGIVTASLDQIVFRTENLLIRRETSVRITFNSTVRSAPRRSACRRARWAATRMAWPSVPATLPSWVCRWSPFPLPRRPYERRSTGRT